MSTIIDVAKLAEVSTATVSRVINSPETVKRSTLEKVQRAMSLCNYKYNALARGFATKKSNTIGVIIPNINNPIFAESTRGIQDFAEFRKNQVILGNTYYQNGQEETLIQTLREKQIDGLILTSNNPKSAVLDVLIQEKFPFVLLYSTIRKGPISSVGVDNYHGGYLATEHLITFGHRRIGMIAGDFSISDRSYHRWHGYKNCLQKFNIPYDKKLLIQSNYTLEAGKNAIQSMLSQQDPPTAVFCSNDYIALGAMKGAMESGLKLPNEMSIIGFDDMEISSYVIPALTTIRQPAYDMGKIAAEHLFKLIENKETKPAQIMLDLKLVTRESTQKRI